MTTINTTASNLYPFATKAQLKARLETESDFVLQALLVMDGRQEESERDRKETIFKNKRGWMSSHAVWGTRLASKVALGEELTPEEFSKARTMVMSYTKQLAAHFRAQALRDNPALNAVAGMFGVGAL